MARPKTEGLEYYPTDTNTYSDRKIRRLLKEFGAKGYLIYDYLRCLIYQGKGYWVKYDDHLAFDVADFLDCGITEQLVKEVVSGCLRIGLFHEDPYKMFNILTSSGLQKRYMKIKKGGVIDEEVNVMDEKAGVSDDETPTNEGETPQSKVKERKEKEIKAKKEEFKNSLLPFVEAYGREMMNDFYRYWSEANRSMTKLKFETMDTWELSLRLATWDKKQSKFKN